jgi:hypothetical protein
MKKRIKGICREMKTRMHMAKRKKNAVRSVGGRLVCVAKKFALNVFFEGFVTVLVALFVHD